MWGTSAHVTVCERGTQRRGVVQGLAPAHEMADMAEDASGAREVIEGGESGVGSQAPGDAMGRGGKFGEVR